MPGGDCFFCFGALLLPALLNVHRQNNKGTRKQRTQKPNQKQSSSKETKTKSYRYIKKRKRNNATIPKQNNTKHKREELYLFQPCYSRTRLMLTKMTMLLTVVDDTNDSYGTPEELQLLIDAVHRFSDFTSFFIYIYYR